MKKSIIEHLKKKDKQDLYTDERIEIVKQVMQLGIEKDEGLKNWLSLDPENKAEWCADCLIIFIESGKLK